MKKNYLLTSIAIFSFVLLLSCDKENEAEYVGDVLSTINLQYLNAATGLKEDVRKGASISIFYNDASTPIYTGKTTASGIFAYKTPAIGKYKIMVKQTDTIIQFNSSLVTDLDADSLRVDELGYIPYSYSNNFEIVRDSKIELNSELKPETTGLRLKAKDEKGNLLSNAKVCLYNNLNFYTANFPNCGGSIKYLSTNSKGIILLTDLAANTTYYVNAKGKIGLLEISNHYDIKAQTFTSGTNGEIKDADIILK
ncbi:hypothetical protein [Flavobacterium sp. N502540]|uniref:hypothetical protein n=1 Tax=Flavobacterium sp. N502540 TaxID=2986838 RepID=UPI002223F30D|nr:hypothetical protein [Flavobacterium sp. N502540]